MRRTRRTTALGLFTLALAAPAAPSERTNGAWETLEELRAALVADSPLSASFTQTFTPSGFSSGDTETGTIAFDLPDCVRWDYDEPFRKSFLLCGDIGYSWNEGEASGRRTPIAPEESEGLDLLRLAVDELERRYEATLESGSERTVIRLRPTVDGGGVRDATLTLSADGRRVASLVYVDAEGNRMSFELGETRSLADAQILQPPADIEWIED